MTYQPGTFLGLKDRKELLFIKTLSLSTGTFFLRNE